MNIGGDEEDTCQGECELREQEQPDYVADNEGELDAAAEEPSLVSTLMQPQNREVGRSLALSMLLMAVVPIATFYAAHWYLLPMLLADANSKLTCAFSNSRILTHAQRFALTM